MAGIRVDPGPLDELPEWPKQPPAQPPQRYGIEVVGAMQPPGKLEATRQRLRQYLNQGFEALGMEPWEPSYGDFPPQAQPTQPAAPRGRADVDRSGVKTKPAAKPAPEMPATPRGLADRMQNTLSNSPFGGMEPSFLLDLSKRLGMDPLDVMKLGRDDPYTLSMMSEAVGYPPEAIEYVLWHMVEPQVQSNANASLTRR